MIKALVKKELREVAWIGAAALVLYLAFVSNLIGLKLFSWSYAEEHGIPFVATSFIWPFAWISAGLALVLGVRQSKWEVERGTAVFLFHRPLRRTTIIRTKLLTGIAVYFLIAAIPILLYGAWAATPGTHAAPFEWSMTAPAFRVWLAMALLYLGAFASGIRPARLFGSRLLPLAASGLLVAPLSLLPWWIVTLPGTLLFALLFASNIQWEVQQRDF